LDHELQEAVIAKSACQGDAEYYHAAITAKTPGIKFNRNHIVRDEIISGEKMKARIRNTENRERQKKC
jgi:hypothetical protein